MAVAATTPTDTPLTMRATIRPAVSRQARKTIALTIDVAIAGSSTRRRPCQSETWPASSSAATTPTA